MATPAPLTVLIHLHPHLDTLDFTGPLEILSHATHASSTPSAPLPAFKITLTAAAPLTTSGQKLTVQRDISLEEAYASLASYDILLIPGGATDTVLPSRAEPIALVSAFAALPPRDDGRTRYLVSVCTGSLFLAEAGVLDGLGATTHEKYFKVLEEIVGRKGSTRVLEERFVVNKAKNGLRVVTSGGVSCGMDASLWLVGTVAGAEAKESVAAIIQYAWREGIVL